MLGTLRNLLSNRPAAELNTPVESESRALRVAVAGLLHEMIRSDLKETREETDSGISALMAIFRVPEREAQELLDEAGAHRFTSYFGPVSIVKRLLSMESRVALVEHLWQVALADGDLDTYEDHFVRKIAHLLYVTNTETMMARQRARRAAKVKE